MCEAELLKVLSCIIEKVVRKYDGVEDTGRSSIFTASTVPNISIRNYLERIRKYFHCSVECFVFSLIYIDRIIQSANFVVNSHNIHRLILTSVMLATKFFDDCYYVNSYYADVGGIPVGELNSLEINFLISIDFNLHVDPDVYQRYHNELYIHSLSGLCSFCYGLSFPSLTEVKLPNRSSFLAYVMHDPRLPQSTTQPNKPLSLSLNSSPCNIVSDNGPSEYEVMMNGSSCCSDGIRQQQQQQQQCMQQQCMQQQQQQSQHCSQALCSQTVGLSFGASCSQPTAFQSFSQQQMIY